MDALKVVAVASSEQTRAELLTQLKALEFIEFQGVTLELSDAVRQCQTVAPDVILVELTGRELDGGLFIQAIGMNPENPCVIFALHQEMDLKVFQEAVKRGAKEFIQYPEDRQGLDTALKKHMMFLSKVVNQGYAVAQQSSKPVQNGKLLTVFSAKGGSGCSTVAANLAYELQVGHKKSVLLLDLDQVFCNSAVTLNLKPSYSLGDLAENNPGDVDEALIRKIVSTHESGLELIVGSKNVLDDNEMASPELLEVLINSLVSRYDYIVVDLPTHVLDPYHQYLVERADTLLLVSCPDVPSLYRTRQYLDLAQKYLDMRKVKLILNRHNLKAVYGMTNETLESEFRYEIFSRLPNDWELNVEANSLGTLLSKVNPRSELVKGLQKLTSQLAGEETTETKPAEESNGLLGKLFGAKNTKEQKGTPGNVIRQTR